MKCLFGLLLRHIQPTQAIVTVKNTQSLMSRVHTYDTIPDNGLSLYTLNWRKWVLETLNWVPGMHDKVPLVIAGAMPLLNPR